MNFQIFVILGLVLLQFYLSKKENKSTGRILPIIFFLLSIVSSILAYSDNLLVFVIINVFYTIPLLGIYLFCRRKLKKTFEKKEYKE